jgi:Protein of unknown function (DUF3307)
MELTAALLLSHLVGDFPLQTNQIYRLKSQSWVGIALHVAIHVIVTALLIRRPLSVWPMLLLLAVLHFSIDLLKVRLPLKRQSLGFLLDQAAHLLVLLFLSRVWSTATASVLPLYTLMPMIIYGLFLATLVFLWVAANELAASGFDHQPYIRWARSHLLQLSQYAGLPLLLSVAAHWYRGSARSS